ncbi:hypothetical protein OG481_01990 [Streptomyces longwoodensis]|uniref:hypothetical protein n=1 Tax=Streptomyces longwoodensis TaxID=68231 RepID=UPI002DD8BAE8|nr:hypothetical protein [Streptomyces longwoodensis]WRY87363.1 hypothetical protein OG481_01990 [Streptomyces longwoodensis]
MAEAFDTLITLGWWALAWLIVLGVVGSICILTALATGAYTCRLIWRTARRPAWARTRHQARQHARRTRPDYQEAA